MWLLSMSTGGCKYWVSTDITEIIEMNGIYNIMLDNAGDLYLEKDNCVIEKNIITYRKGNTGLILEYVGNG